MEFVDQRFTKRTCSTCKRELPSQFFSKNSSAKSGYRSNCKECARTSKSSWYGRNKGVTVSRRSDRRQSVVDAVNQIKCGPCHDCGLIKHPSLMEFDHVRGEKFMNISKMTRAYSIPAVLAEIDKCDLVCVECHRIRTWNRQNPDDQIKRTW